MGIIVESSTRLLKMFKCINVENFFLSIAASPLFSVCLKALFFSVSLSPPHKKPSLLQLVSSHKPQQALPTMFLHKCCPFYCK